MYSRTMIFPAKNTTKVVERGRKCGGTSDVGSKEEDQEGDEDHEENLRLLNQRFTRYYLR